jgi:TPR repeat protein
VPVSYAEAARWSKLAADGGHGGAGYNLAKICGAGGPGLAADRGEAEKWAKVATAKGFPDALRVKPERPPRSAELVAIFEEGQRFCRAGDMTRAASVFARCAQMGDAPCQLQLGWHHEEGKVATRPARRWRPSAGSSSRSC